MQIFKAESLGELFMFSACMKTLLDEWITLRIRDACFDVMWRNDGSKSPLMSRNVTHYLIY